jgi:hypothetical protein
MVVVPRAHPKPKISLTVHVRRGSRGQSNQANDASAPDDASDSSDSSQASATSSSNGFATDSQANEADGEQKLACSFVGDAGSTGNRLQMYTASDMCPDQLYLHLDCGGGEFYPHLYVFADPRGLQDRSFLLTMRQIVVLHAGIPLKAEETFLDEFPQLKQPGYMTKCIGNTMLNELLRAKTEEACSTVRLDIDATAGVRNYERQLRDDGREEEAEKYGAAAKDIDMQWRRILAPYESHGISFKEFRVLRIKDEATLEATAVRLWSQSVLTAAGSKVIDTISGIFSMGGKSSQFIRFKTHSNVAEGLFLLPYGHKQGLADYNQGTGATDEERRRQVEDGLDKAFQQAKDQGKFIGGDNFGTGLWIGVTNTEMAAKSPSGLNLKTGAEAEVYPYTTVKERMDEALQNIDTNDKKQKKMFIKLIIINYWLERVFTDGANFYFRHEWPTPKSSPGGGRCVYAEWPSIEAVLGNKALQEDLGISNRSLDFAQVKHY